MHIIHTTHIIRHVLHDMTSLLLTCGGTRTTHSSMSSPLSSSSLLRGPGAVRGLNRLTASETSSPCSPMVSAEIAKWSATSQRHGHTHEAECQMRLEIYPLFNSLMFTVRQTTISVSINFPRTFHGSLNKDNTDKTPGCRGIPMFCCMFF